MSDGRELTDDLILPFQLESTLFRGRLVRLGPALDLILRQHAYPEPVATLLGEAVTVASALAASLKYDGVFTLQAKGDGAVRMLVADVTNDGGVRAYAQYDAEKLAAVADASGGALLGKGYLAFTCTLAETDDRYQGIVELSGNGIAEAVQHYFRQSEQVPTGLVAAVVRDGAGAWRGGCLLLQQMPREGGLAAPTLDVESNSPAAEDWTRTMMVMGTCKPEELTDPALEPTALLYRLFHEEGVRVYDAHALRHQCRCSRERVAAMLASLPSAEVESLAVNGTVSVTCEFCNSSYSFDEAARRGV
jgi:molecular chaperone Hsp33